MSRFDLLLGGGVFPDIGKGLRIAAFDPQIDDAEPVVAQELEEMEDRQVGEVAADPLVQ